jgi:hypothetical protein
MTKPIVRLALGLVAAVVATMPFAGVGPAGRPPEADPGHSFVPAPLVAVPDPFVPPPSACQLTAFALKNAAIRSAQDDFWVAVAKCRNGPDVGECIDEAHDEMDEAIALASDQYWARLELCPLLGSGKYDPVLDPNDFSSNVTNPYFPIVPNRILLYSKMTSEGLEEVEVTFLPGTVMIAGIPCAAVSAIERLNGAVREDTIDWYSQKSDGTAWYVGEIAKNYDDEGFLENVDGSWRHGTDGAKAGIIMLAMPMVGAAYRQEFLPGEAEDWAKVVTLGVTVTVPAGTFMGCVETEDGTPIEPGNVERKFYAPGVGLVKEFDPVSGESLELQMIIN